MYINEVSKVIYDIVNYLSPFWVIPFLTHVILLVLLLGYEGCKGII